MAMTRRTLLATSLAVPAALQLTARIPYAAADTAADTAAETGSLLGAAFKAGENLPSVVHHLDFNRFFFSTGRMATAQSWANQRQLTKAYNQYGCRAFSISFKPDTAGVAFSHPDNVARFLDTAPDDVDLYLTFFHEHDGDLRDGTLTRATYQNGSAVVADAAHAAGMEYGPIHNGVNYDPSHTPHWGLWPSIWAANEADVAYDFWGVDVYSKNYQNPSWMDPTKAYADSLGLPLLIGELAAPADNPTKQAVWAAQARAWCLTNTAWASWWSSQVSSSSTNYRLSTASAAAWLGI